MKLFLNISVGVWIFSAALFLFVPKDVVASDGFYASVSSGSTWVKDALDYTDGSTKIKGKMDTGYGLLMALGHDFGLIRLEAELSHFSSDIDSVSIAANKYSTSGDVSSTSLMLNGYLELENETPFTPYIGGGVGYARVKVAGKAAMGGFFNTTIRWNDTNSVFAYQGGCSEFCVSVIGSDIFRVYSGNGWSTVPMSDSSSELGASSVRTL